MRSQTQGDGDGAQADIDAARAINPDIAKNYVPYGVE
jgi:hypothetical protein